MPAEAKRKPREKRAPYKCKPKARVPKDTPATSAIPEKTRENLTLHDWMIVFMYMDSHPDLGQHEIVKHFKTKPGGTLIFNQSTLSRKLKKRTELEARAQSTPNVLSSKCPRI